ncbi:MAG: hypothetical protein WAU40_00600, partial [Nitrospira sp.]
SPARFEDEGDATDVVMAPWGGIILPPHSCVNRGLTCADKTPLVAERMSATLQRKEPACHHIALYTDGESN